MINELWNKGAIMKNIGITSLPSFGKDLPVSLQSLGSEFALPKNNYDLGLNLSDLKESMAELNSQFLLVLGSNKQNKVTSH